MKRKEYVKKIGILLLMVMLLTAWSFPVLAAEPSGSILVDGQILVEPYNINMNFGQSYTLVFLVEGAISYRWYGRYGNGSTFILNSGVDGYYSASGISSSTLVYTRFSSGVLSSLYCVATLADGSTVTSAEALISPFQEEPDFSSGILGSASLVISFIIGWMRLFLSFIVANPVILMLFLILLAGTAIAFLIRLWKSA